MAESKNIRLNKVLREFNISLDRAVEHLKSKGFEVEARPTTRISGKEYKVLSDAFQSDKSKKVAVREEAEEQRKEKEALQQAREKELENQRKERKAAEVIRAKAKLEGPKSIGKINLDSPKPIIKTKEEPVVKTEEPKAPKKEKVEKVAPVEKTVSVEKTAPVEEQKMKKTEKNPDLKKEKTEKPKKPAKEETKPVVKKKKQTGPKIVTEIDEVTGEKIQAVKTEYKKLEGLTLTGKTIDLDQFKKPEPKKSKNSDKNADNKRPRGRRRKRIPKPSTPAQPGANSRQHDAHNRRGRRRGAKKAAPKEEPTTEEVQRQVRETLEKLQGKSRGRAARYRRERRDEHRLRAEQELAAQEASSKQLQVTEFVTVSEIATMMDVPVTNVISTCMSLGLMVTMNQRLDAETLAIVADEFGYSLEFITADIEEAIQQDQEDKPEDLVTRAPIITVMGHVDHGKTSLLDYIRKANVIAGESGGITQHIGAYGVELKNGKKIAFLDTPGHEAFTAMRARGTQVTDVAVIVIATDDEVMPTTKEAISHAQAAGVPIIFALNKVDKPTANPDNIKQQLASMNLLIEDWGGKIQSQEISAKTGVGIDELLDKVLLEAEMLELKANPDRVASGTVVEAFLDRGRGYVSTVLVQNGTLRVGDYVLAGQHSGKVRAMSDERGNNVEVAGPSTPVSVLGLDGAPQAGDNFNVFEDEREAKDIAARRMQLQREQSVRTQRHITLDEIGRRIALGDFKELNIILKGDVDGSVEALTDSFGQMSTEEIQINIIHKGVGAITENDVLLATASDAVIIGFNVRPMGNARQIADREEIDIRTYSIIYDAIDDLKDAMEGMLSPELREEETGTVEIRETFKISRIGTIAGCFVTNGKIYRNSSIRLIRDGVVLHTGELQSLKRFKDDVREVGKGYECGVQIRNFNDLEEGDIIEAFREVEVKRSLGK